MSPAIIAENLGKRYQIHHEARADTLRDAMQQGVRGLWRKLRARSVTTEGFWAIKDLSFQIETGDVLGIIGRNGAGKSTLLKVLSRITEPTVGRLQMKGRVASLLEVGTGFHPELSGRENIFLNGAILGMPRAEITRKFDEIVEFAEVNRFLDTPVKRYSSGMYVRLAFAVAAHLDPDILIVDEVLAVGDGAFQEKCVGKMKAVSEEGGRTVLFVSHNLAAIRGLTQNCIFLKQGQLHDMGPTNQVVEAYQKDTRSSLPLLDTRGKHTRILSARMIDREGQNLSVHNGEQPTRIEVTLDTDGRPDLFIECFLQNGEGERWGFFSPGHLDKWRMPAIAGRWRVVLTMQIPPLASGSYAFDLATTLMELGQDHVCDNLIPFSVYAPSMRPAAWELKREYQAGHFIMDSVAAPAVERLPS